MHANTSNIPVRGETEPGTEDIRDVLADRELIVVSNRQPYAHTYDDDEVVVEAATGGLTSGLDPFVQATGGTWIAWGDGDADRQAVDDRDRVAVPPGNPAYTLRRVWLSETEVREYYAGFSNRVLWPVCHGFLGNLHNEESHWQRYQAVNARFSDVVAEEANRTDDPVVWLQDYHLALVPRMVRPEAPSGTDIAHFWHVPWPSWDIFRACPHGRELLRGLLGNDVLGFHVPRYRKNFLHCVHRALETARVDSDANRVRFENHTTRVEACPLGVDRERIQNKAQRAADADPWSSIPGADDFDGNNTVALGVERLDYTKGIPERLRALERVWETEPHWRGELTYVQNAAESRSQIPEYREVQRTVESEVERINDRFGTEDWTPIAYTTERIPDDQLYSMFRCADLAIVSPIRDGLNLVAPEYVAAQGPDPGTLVLSDQTGVHDRLGEYALSVSPHDISEFAETIKVGLDLLPENRRRRMDHLQECVAADSLSRWVYTFVAAATQEPRNGPGLTQRPL